MKKIKNSSAQNPTLYVVRQAPVNESSILDLKIWSDRTYAPVLLDEKDATKKDGKICYSLKYLIERIRTQRFDAIAKEAIEALSQLRTTTMIFMQGGLQLLK